MPLKAETEINEDGTESVFVFDTEKPEERHLTFHIDAENLQLYFYPREEFITDKVEIHGFKRIPPEISELGYFKAGLSYYFNKKFQGKSFVNKTTS